MEQRVWQWKSPWEKRIYLLCSLFYLCILHQEHVTAVEAGYRQESKNEVQDSSKIDSLSNFLPYDAKEDSDYKRGSAFFPLRGKKPSSEDSTAPRRLFSSDEMDDKRSQFFPLRGKKVPDDLKRASYFMPMRGRKNDVWTEEDYDISDESPNKRASSFMPMRGKKKYAAISDFLTKVGTYANDVNENPSSSHSYETADKRKYSFVPVRGKRSIKESESLKIQVPLSTNDSYEEPATNHSPKKRSVSFMPMRGRRESDTDSVGGIATSLLKKKKYSFVPMRGRRKSSNSEDDSLNLDKKAKFMPMRGRRLSDDDFEYLPTDDIATKKAQSFMPMRGRRTQLRDIVFESSNIPDLQSRLIEDKRASSFMPMRGRRDALVKTKDSQPDFSKRPSSSFTLMRGRRSTNYIENNDASENTLYRHKRSAFSPMQGHRPADDHYKSESEDIEVEPWPADQLISLLDKKASAFMPMRGRRVVGENFTVDPWPAEELMSLFNKKASSFMPMRGRRMFDRENITVDPWPAEQLMSLFNKKSAFMPMRGRRDSREDSEELDYDENGDKRSSYFMPMRGRRFDNKVMNFYNPYPYLMPGIGSSLMSKPVMDQGDLYSSVRSVANERRKKLRINWDAVKRAFHASRGKRFNEVDDFIQSLKDSYTSGDHSETDGLRDDSAEDLSQQTRLKRSILRPRMAMQPNRQYIALKRPMSFFATRGKRLDDSAVDKISEQH